MDWMVNNNWLALILVCMLRTYRTYNPMVKFLKYEFNNNLLGSVTLFKVILCVTWTQWISFGFFRRLLESRKVNYFYSG